MKQSGYAGLHNDQNGGMTHWGQMVKDAWVFGLIPDTEDCAGWTDGQLQVLYEKIWGRMGKVCASAEPPASGTTTTLYTHTPGSDRARQSGRVGPRTRR